MNARTKVTQINVEGRRRKATLVRSASGELVVNLHGPQPDSWVVNLGADIDEQAAGILARRLQYAVDGHVGTAGDVAGYRLLVDLME